MRAIVMTAPGGPEVLRLVERPEGSPGKGEALVEIMVAGVNFMDIGVRRGMAWADVANPKVLGVEGAGRVLSVGDGVDQVHPGQRVAWVYAPGSYADRLIIPVEALVPVPDNIDDRTAAAAMMQGLTASHFASEFYAVRPGDVALVHAAAGGLGLFLTQTIKLAGGVVIGRVSHANKAAVACAAGADHVIVDPDGLTFAEEAIRLSSGQGVHVVYDGSGPNTFKGSLRALRRNGTLCWYGPVLGGPGPIELGRLPKSIKLGYGIFFDHISTPALLRERSTVLFHRLARGALRVRIGGEYPLEQAANAHADIESRGTTGKLLLIP